MRATVCCSIPRSRPPDKFVDPPVRMLSIFLSNKIQFSVSAFVSSNSVVTLWSYVTIPKQSSYYNYSVIKCIADFVSINFFPAMDPDRSRTAVIANFDRFSFQLSSIAGPIKFNATYAVQAPIVLISFSLVQLKTTLFSDTITKSSP
eukprot:EC096167.1.p2 GENE.EC096167.1~~EC096167.1.p2  ORF type:complete len:147 (-),score=9.26 EC096167.1:66-506(-)